VWDLKDLGLQATQRIASGADPLRLLMDISQNFPSLASSLSRMQVIPCAWAGAARRLTAALLSGGMRNEQRQAVREMRTAPLV